MEDCLRRLMMSNANEKREAFRVCLSRERGQNQKTVECKEWQEERV